MKLFLATGNKGKVEELIPLIGEFFPKFKEIIARAPKDAEETEDTFVGNSKIKAEALARELLSEGEAPPFATLSDDSGLEVFALGGKPGVHSARYGGVHADSARNIAKLLAEMSNLNDEQRNCRYVCCLYLHIQKSATESAPSFAEGYCGGKVMRDAKGSGGFGYDPAFFSPDLNKRMSEASTEEKNRHSHRRKAFELLAGRDSL
jgi:XTP/dITP diphosphohydrolase